MALIRDRRAFPRWSFVDSREPALPRRAIIIRSTVPDQDWHRASTKSATASVAEPENEQAKTNTPGTATKPQLNLSAAAQAEDSGFVDIHDWFAAHDWPTTASVAAVQLATPRGRSPREQLPPGLPTASPAEVRAKNGRGFSSLAHVSRRRRRGQSQVKRRSDVDVAALEAAIATAALAFGERLEHIVVWHDETGLPLASHGNHNPELAPTWHRAMRDVRVGLSHTDLSAPGSYQLLGLSEQRLAVLIQAPPVLGACVTLDLSDAAMDNLLATALPSLRSALIATSRRY